jgi:hypothetical protein
VSLRLPPRIKVLEALGAVVDGRVRLVGEGRCEVVSSEGDRVYNVVVEGGFVYSNDNGTLYRGYVGYPILACLMAEGRLPIDAELGEKLRGVPWRRLNEQYKRYEDVLRHIYAERGIERERVEAYIDAVLRRLAAMRLRLKKPTG